MILINSPVVKKVCLGFAFFLSVLGSDAQAFNTDSVKTIIAKANDDTTKVKLLATLVNYYNRFGPDSAFPVVISMIDLSHRLKYPYGEAWGYVLMATTLDRRANFTQSYEKSLACLKIAEKLDYGKESLMSMAYTQMGLLEGLSGQLPASKGHLYEALNLAKVSGKPETEYYQIYTHLASTLNRSDSKDSGFYFAQKGYQIALTSPNKVFAPYAANLLGSSYWLRGDFQKAKEMYRAGIKFGIQVNHIFQIANIYNRMSELYKNESQIDSAIYFAKSALNISNKLSYGLPLLDASRLLKDLYKLQNKNDSALKYLEVLVAVKDTVFSQARAQQFQLLGFEENQRQEQLKNAQKEYRNKIITYSLAVILLSLLVTALVLFRNNRQKQKANILLDEQKKDLQDTLVELKSTQTQLIQSEKMASLGELTAGIAHEIQNPLNFVNNFSDVNRELIGELQQEIASGNYSSAKKIAHDIVTNEEKINVHGKRADAIVKSMLQHSSRNIGQKEPTDINALCEEYLRLSYHGMRAKDKGLNAVPIAIGMKTDFDPSVNKLNIVRQDIGRVLLNLYNNAFYAVSEKSRTVQNFNPMVSVSTRRIDNKIEITVGDNGIGIPVELKDKIFQPFFTTKPTGQGTGLGLSLSYDIVKKGHNGDLKMESVPMAGSTFKIILSAS